MSVDYRLAIGDVTYPVPLDDVVAAFRWVGHHARNLSMELTRIATGGASAGANLAAGTAIRLRDDGDLIVPTLQLLAYPLVHRVLPPREPELLSKVVEVPRLLRFLDADVELLTTNYPGDAGLDAPGDAFPGHASLAGQPLTVIVTSEYDDLRASGARFVEQLREADVPVHEVVEDEMMHGHLNLSPSVPGTDHSLATFSRALVALAQGER